MSEEAEEDLFKAGLLSEGAQSSKDIFLVGCGGVHVRPKCIHQLNLKIYGQEAIVPTLVVPGQRDQMIVGTNLLKHLLRQFKQDPSYWRVMSKADSTGEPGIEQFLSMLSGITRWKGDIIPDVIGTVKLDNAVTLMPKQEHIVWGKLPGKAPISEGSTILVEPSKSHSNPEKHHGREKCGINEWRQVANPSDKPVTLRRNMKLADVSPCVALEDFELGVDYVADTELKAQGQSVQVITDMSEADLMMEDGVTPSAKKIKSFLGMIMYYQRFIQNCSSMAKPLFSLTAAATGKANAKRASHFKRLSPGDWTQEQSNSFNQLKAALLNSVVLAHPDFGRPFILSTDASLDGLGAVLSQVPEGGSKARPIAFASKALTRPQMKIQDVFRLSTNCQEVKMGGSEVACSSMSSEEVTAVLDGQIEWGEGPKGRAISWLANNVHKLVPPGESALPVFSLKELQDKQQEDMILARVIHYVSRGRRPSRRERVKEPFKVQKTLKQWEKLKMLDGILYRVTKDSLTGKKRYQYVVAASLAKQALQGVHDEAGHQGQHRTLYLARQRFFWTDIERDVREYVKSCKRCVVSKTPEPEGRAPLESIKTTSPLEMVCIDFWSAEIPNGNTVDVLVITDHFTKMAHAFPCHDQSAKQVARQLWDRYFFIYGFPERIHSDQGANFESQLIRELLMISGVKKSRTTAYHPMGNGMVERFNRTLGSMIRALPPRAKQKWPQMLQTLTFAYNCTAHESTGYAPFYLMYERIPRLPIDVMFHNVERDCDIADYDKYVLKLREELKEALSSAQANAVTSQQYQAELYNKRTKGHDIAEGDQVLLSNKCERGRKKLSDKWESVPYVVVSRDPKCHTYRIRNTSSGCEKVVHRNRLLCANLLPLELEEDVESSFIESSESSHGETQSHLSDVATGGVTEDRTTSWVLDSTSANPPSGCLDADEELDLGESVSQRPMSVSSVVDKTGHGNAPPSTAISVVSRIRTRVGRLVKPVDKLIQNMTHKKILV
ncbi:Transposon Ty3-I Gag-Pol polyprotein [Merluccius polli]|uniref:Gypsy retrotransposon integrase-like protein 1 n=1 Tax=Merluccius polli TaxID=89951 RepID=A0AA47MGB5_MERPO|nr:Transposon Ty3-I Gag-Pol polyprotein [Merluccius polli]